MRYDREDETKSAVRELPLHELLPELKGKLEVEDDPSRERQVDTAVGYVLQLSKDIFLNGTDVTLDKSKAFIRTCADFFQVFSLRQRDKASKRLKAIEDAIIQKVDVLIMKAAGEDTTVDRLAHTNTVRVDGKTLEYTEMPRVADNVPNGKVLVKGPQAEGIVNTITLTDDEPVHRKQTVAQRKAELDAVATDGPFKGLTWRQERDLTTVQRLELLEKPNVPKVAEARYRYGRYKRVQNFDVRNAQSTQLTEEELNDEQNRTEFYSTVLKWAKAFDEKKWQAELTRLSGDTQKAEQMMIKLNQERADYLASIAQNPALFTPKEGSSDAPVGHSSFSRLESRSLYPELYARIAELFVQEAEEEALSERMAQQQKEQQEKDDKQKLQDERNALRQENADKSWGRTGSASSNKDQESVTK